MTSKSRPEMFGNSPCAVRSALFARFAATSFVIMAVVGAAAHAQSPPPEPANAAEANQRGEIILFNLPPRGSKPYNQLLGLAGKTARGQILPLTKTEMWSMPLPRIEDVVRGSEGLGVTVTRLGPDWNVLLKTATGSMAMNPNQEDMMNNMKRAPATMSVKMMTMPHPALMEYALTKDIEGKAIGAPPPKSTIASIIIPLDDTRTIIAHRSNLDVRENGYIWRGNIDGTGEPVMVMWRRGGSVSGMFAYRGRVYTLKDMGGNIHAMVETDAAKMPPDHGAMKQRGTTDTKPSEPARDPLVKSGEGATMRDRDRTNIDDRRDAIGGMRQLKPQQEARANAPPIVPISQAARRQLAAKPITIDLMVLYTDKVRNNYIDVELDLIALAVEQANTAFSNSGVGNVKLRLVHSGRVTYDESDGEYFDHLYRMVDAKPGFESVRALRNEKRADIVALIVDDPSGCGLSTRVAANEDEAYAVVHHTCAALSYSLAHEIGHIIGARHDRSLDDNPYPFPYGHGYVNGNKWRDIMSYESSCNGCPRQPFWSNPTVTFMGDKGGLTETDNARVILEQADRVARFR